MSIFDNDKDSLEQRKVQTLEEIEFWEDPIKYHTRRMSEEIAESINARIIERLMKQYDKSTV